MSIGLLGQPAETSAFAELLPSLRRLDALLAKAAETAEPVYGSKASSDPYRGLYVTAAEVERLVEREPGVPLFPASLEPPPANTRMSRLQAVFGLTIFDADAMLIALAPELDLRYERLYAYLQDDVTRRRPSVDLVLNLLCASVDAKIAARARFAPDAPLIRHRLISLVADAAQPNQPLLAHYLKADESVVRWILAQPGLDARLLPFSSLESKPAGCSSEPSRAMQTLAAEACGNGSPLRFYLCGRRGLGKRAAASGVAHSLNAALLTVDLARAITPPLDMESTLTLLFREARLHRVVLYFENFDALRADTAAALLRTFVSRLADSPGVTLVAGEAPWRNLDARLIEVEFPSPSYRARLDAWRGRLAASSIEVPEGDLEVLAEQFKFTTEQIDSAVTYAENRTRLLTAGKASRDVKIAAPELFGAARAHCSNELGVLARKVAAGYSWGDIVLPADQLAQLREICSQARHRHIVYGDWGFDRKLSLGKGLNVLFSGPPGTGKTMAAEVIANDLGLDLYKIDLSQIVSKYIGETEKNLNKIFDAARSSNAIIFFDEADALFGKRSEVRDSHDRYANIEISYLLQKMEEYEGISILATNLRQNLDQAFMRRLSFTVDFPFPSERSRRLIWDSIWPEQTPLSADLDLDFMAAQFKISGGSVKNIAVAASFLAVEEKTKVNTLHLLKAARREFQKMGRTATKAEFGRYWDLLERQSA